MELLIFLSFEGLACGLLILRMWISSDKRRLLGLGIWQSQGLHRDTDKLGPGSNPRVRPPELWRAAGS